MRSHGCGDEDDGVGGRVSGTVHGHTCVKFPLAVGRSCATGFVLRQRVVAEKKLRPPIFLWHKIEIGQQSFKRQGNYFSFKHMT